MRQTNLRAELAQFVKDQQSLQVAITGTPTYHHYALNESGATNSGAAMTKGMVRSNPTVVNPADGNRYALSTRAVGLLFGNSIRSDKTHTIPNKPIPYTVVKHGDQLYFVDSNTQNSNTFPAFIRFNAAPVKKPHDMQTLIVLWRHAQYDLLDRMHDDSTRYLIDARTLKTALTDAFGERCANAVLKHTQYESEYPNTKKPIVALQTYHLTLAAYAEEMIYAAKTAEQLTMLVEHIQTLFQLLTELQPKGKTVTPNDILIKLKNPNLLSGDGATLLMSKPDIDAIVVAEENTLAYALHKSADPLAQTPYPKDKTHPFIEKLFAIYRQQEIQTTRTQFIKNIQNAIQKREANRDPGLLCGARFFTTHLQRFTESFQRECEQGNQRKALSFFEENLTLFTQRTASVFEKHELIQVDHSTGRRSLAPKLNAVL